MVVSRSVAQLPLFGAITEGFDSKIKFNTPDYVDTERFLQTPVTCTNISPLSLLTNTGRFVVPGDKASKTSVFQPLLYHHQRNKAS